jgi:hypothetical protein
MLFALDDVAEKGEWESVHMGIESVFHALTTALGSLHDVITLASQVRHIHASSLDFPFCASNSCFSIVSYGAQPREILVPLLPEGCLGPPR